MQAETFVFFGIVGSGKGTQVRLLQEFLRSKDGKDQVYAYPGNEFRRLIESGTHVGELIKESMNKGQLQPDFLTNSIFANILVSELLPDKHLIIDGYPRTINQAENFEKMMVFFGRPNIKIIHIELSKEEAKRRNLLRARHDDTEESINQRFREYEQNVIPAMDYFRNKKGFFVFSVNGEQSIEKVHEDIKKVLSL